MRYARLALAAGLAAWLLSGCGNEQKGSAMLMLDTLGRHPAVMEAGQTFELAQMLAAMNLTRAQAQALANWAASDGASIRAELNDGLAKAAGAAAETRAAGLEMVQRHAADWVDRQAILDAHKLKADDPLNVNGTLALPRPGQEDVEAKDPLKPELLARLEPTVATLRDEQRMAAIGTWGEAVKAVVEYQTAKADARDGKRTELVGKALECVGKGDGKDLAAKLNQPLAKIPTGLTKPRHPEDDLRALLDVLPPAKPADQTKEATRALAAMLSLPPAVSLLQAAAG